MAGGGSHVQASRPKAAGRSYERLQTPGHQKPCWWSYFFGSIGAMDTKKESSEQAPIDWSNLELKKSQSKQIRPTKGQIVFIIFVVLILLAMISGGSGGGDCERKATIGGQWHSGIYHQCMGTPEGFRW
jgi:hypothetical protein